MREARAVSALNHPNICTLFDVGQDYLVLEFVPGEAPRGPMPLDMVLDCARQLARRRSSERRSAPGLEAANIRVTPHGIVKSLDFGLAQRTHAGDGLRTSASCGPTLPLETATQNGVIQGTVA